MSMWDVACALCVATLVTNTREVLDPRTSALTVTPLPATPLAVGK
jgi:hypothetical protein